MVNKRVTKPKSRRSLRVLIRELDRETAKPTKGSIERCAEIYKEMNAVHLAKRIARDNRELRKEGRV